MDLGRVGNWGQIFCKNDMSGFTALHIGIYTMDFGPTLVKTRNLRTLRPLKHWVHNFSTGVIQNP